MPENTKAARCPTWVTRWRSTRARWENCWTLCWARWSPSLKRAVLALKSICRLAIVAILRACLLCPAEWPNELSPDTGTGLHRLGTLTAQQVVWRQQLPPPHILAKGGRPVIDDISRVPGQHFHQAIMPPAPALQRQLEFLPSH